MFVTGCCFSNKHHMFDWSACGWFSGRCCEESKHTDGNRVGFVHLPIPIRSRPNAFRMGAVDAGFYGHIDAWMAVEKAAELIAG